MLYKELQLPSGFTQQVRLVKRRGLRLSRWSEPPGLLRSGIDLRIAHVPLITVPLPSSLRSECKASHTRTCRTQSDFSDAYEILTKESERKISLSRCKWKGEDKLRVDFNEVAWIDLSQIGFTSGLLWFLKWWRVFCQLMTVSF